MRHSSW